MKHRTKNALICLLAILFIMWLACRPDVSRDILSQSIMVDQTPKISPDYSNTVIPPNIAPLNFEILEKGSAYFVEIKSQNGDPIQVYSTDPLCSISLKAWKELLAANKGKTIQFNIFVHNKGKQWLQYKTIYNRVAEENIDPYLAYRLIDPASDFWRIMGIYQRNLENFDETPILLNRLTKNNCMNCHNFMNNDPNTMVMHLRAGPGSGTLIAKNGKITKVNTSTDFSKAGAYPAWHPNGKLVAFSVNKLQMFFHSTGEPRDVLDHASDLIVYNIPTNTITTSISISSPDRMENFPAWSPDGKFLYFCSADKMEKYFKKDGEFLWDQIYYDLMRVRYDSETDTWGKPETLIDGDRIKKSITEPRVSPDGRFVLFTTAKYGNFPIYLKSADVCLLDLSTGIYKVLPVNSDQTDSFHSWSSNSRWFVFSSKRDDGFCARPYFSYVDKDGNASKPFLLPQKNPNDYKTFIKTYNVPELIKGPVPYRPQSLSKAAMNNKKLLKANLDPKVQPRVQEKTPDQMYTPAPG